MSSAKRLRYYYYISEPKVSMLHAQRQGGKLKLPRVNRIELAGFGIGAETGQSSRDTLIERTQTLESSLDKEGLVGSLPSHEDASTGQFYRDNGVWRSGLFSLSGGMEAHGDTSFGVVTYILWRALGENIYLLIGSPSNILGDKVVREGFFVPGSSGAVETINRFVSDYFEIIDETLAVVPNRTHGSVKHVEDTQLDFKPEETISDRHLFWTSRDASPVALGLFCLRHLARLPSARTELLFRVLSIKNLPPKPMKDEEFSRWSGRTNLWDFKRICVGSPIYTTTE